MNYLRSARLARKMIAKNGAKAVLRTPAGSPMWDNETASYTETYDEYQGVCLVTNYEQKDIDGTLIEVGDKRLLCIFPAEPKPKVSLVDVYKKNGELDATYNVVTFGTLAPDSSTVILYQVQGRK
jgi:regulator of extracellular matrix RemA (YlzA/DUF370 family)